MDAASTVLWQGFLTIPHHMHQHFSFRDLEEPSLVRVLQTGTLVTVHVKGWDVFRFGDHFEDGWTRITDIRIVNYILGCAALIQLG